MGMSTIHSTLRGVSFIPVMSHRSFEDFHRILPVSGYESA